MGIHSNVATKPSPFHSRVFQLMDYANCVGLDAATVEAFLVIAQQWVDHFVHWYNTEHRHSEIRFVTPDERHYGQEKAILDKRKEVYEMARQKNPGRWTRQTRNWEPIEVVVLNPAPKRPSEEGLNIAV